MKPAGETKYNRYGSDTITLSENNISLLNLRKLSAFIYKFGP